MPAASIITHEFTETAQTMLDNQGAREFRFVEVPHPINILDEGQIDALAEGAVEEIVKLLTSS